MAIKSICFAVVALMSAAGEVRSTPIPVPGLTGVTLDLFEQLRSATLTLSGGPVDTTESKVFPSAFTYQGTMWKTRVTFNLTDSAGGDNIFLLVRLFHDAQPDGVAIDDGAGGTAALGAFGSTTGPAATGGWNLTGFPDTETHGMHFDRYNVGAASITGVAGQPGQIANWSLEIKGVHVVPEPATLLLTGLALMGGAWKLRRISKRDV